MTARGDLKGIIAFNMELPITDKAVNEVTMGVYDVVCNSPDTLAFISKLCEDWQLDMHGFNGALGVLMRHLGNIQGKFDLAPSQNPG